jgi:hypothetical protein
MKINCFSLFYFLCGTLLLSSVKSEGDVCTAKFTKSFAFDNLKMGFMGQFQLNGHIPQVALIDSGASISRFSKVSAQLAKVVCAPKFFFTVETIDERKSRSFVCKGTVTFEGVMVDSYFSVANVVDEASNVLGLSDLGSFGVVVNLATGSYTHEVKAVQCDIAQQIKAGVEANNADFVDLATIKVDANQAYNELKATGAKGLLVFEHQEAHGRKFSMISF